MKKNTDYLKIKRGNIPLIFSVPHGGTLDCKAIPDRKKGVIGIDKHTVQLTENLIGKITKTSRSLINKDSKPSYVISHIKREKIDFNRRKERAFYGNSKKAYKIYRLYHNSIKKLILGNLDSFNKSLLIDIHGFEQEDIPRGFRIVDIVLGTNNLATLFPDDIPKKKRDQNIRGKIIEVLLKNDIKVAPGHPKRKEYVLKGGYITKKYGASRYHRNSQTLQIEFSDEVRVNNGLLKEEILKLLAEIFIDQINQ
jgi:N-formylglutamate amidohydrolase